MCSLFGLIDYQNTLTTRQKNHILQVLAKECEVRGTDATGIAYNFGGSIRVYKRPLAAHKLKFHVPNGVRVVMGHTRLATQGRPTDNFNNHPWSTGSFALAHNGVLWNDKELRQTENLPDTHIQTDSYVAVQLLEQAKALDFMTSNVMAEKIQGSFVFTVLDREDNLYFVRGDNPLAIFDFGGFYLYASTEEILRRAMRKLHLHHQEAVNTEEGDILKIDRTGQCSFGHFNPNCSFQHFWRNPRFRMLSWFDEVDEPEAIDGQTDLLIQAAKSMGVSEDEVLALLDLGYDPCEIEELRMGFQPDNKITFAEYAAYFLEIRRKNGLKRSTCARYEGLLVRINAAIGGMKLVDLRPQHLNLFYQNLQEKGVIRRPETGRAKPRFQQILQRDKISQEKLSRLSGVASSTIRRARNGETIRWEKIQLLANALQCPAEELFEAQDCSESRLSPKTVLEHHRLIRTILAWAEREMLVPYNAASKATPPKATRTIVNTFQPEEITAILQALEDEPIKWRTLVHLMIVTGCRRGEIMGLKWEHVDLEQGILCICETLLASDVGVYADTPKTTDSRRYINIPRETIQLLREYHTEQESWREAVGDRWANTGYVFTRDTGEPMHPDSINGWLIAFSERHGLRHINPHAFRHAMASILIYSGTDILSISKRLGHTTTNTTLNFYGHLLQKADAQSAECIANVLLRPYGKSDNEK